MRHLRSAGGAFLLCISYSSQHDDFRRMNAHQNGVTRIVSAAFCSCLLMLAIRAVASKALIPGTVVWWDGGSQHDGPTNGVVDFAGDTVTNITAIVVMDWDRVLLNADGFVSRFSVQSGDCAPIVLSNVVAISESGNALWAMRKDGSVAFWGGRRDFINVVPGLSNIVAIASEGFSGGSFAVDEKGALLGFCIREGQVEGGVRSVSVAGQILTNIAGVAAPTLSPVVVVRDGSVFTLGYRQPGQPIAEPIVNASGQLTFDPGGEFWKTPYEYVSKDPVMCGGRPLTNVVAVSGVMALQRGGDIFILDPSVECATASQVTGISNVTAIASNGQLNLALKSDGTVMEVGKGGIPVNSVPAGLSNVVAIATAGSMGLAITTGRIPLNVHVNPHGRLEEMEREADLIFKGRVLSTRAVTNGMFPDWAKTHATRFVVISVLKGVASTNEVTFWHMTGGPGSWGGGAFPTWLDLVPGKSYLVFGKSLERPGYLYNVPSDATIRPNEFRQFYRDGIMQTVDERPLAPGSVNQVHWKELNWQLQSLNPTNQLYGIEVMDLFSSVHSNIKRKYSGKDLSRSPVFRREAVLAAVLPLITNLHEQVAISAIDCFGTESNAAFILSPFMTALEQVAIHGPSSARRLGAIDAVSRIDSQMVSNSLALLLEDPDEKIRFGAVQMLPRFPAAFAAGSLKRKAGDESASVRAAVADVIGEGRYVQLLPTLSSLFEERDGRDALKKPSMAATLQAGLPSDTITDVYTTAGFALVKFDLGDVGGILRSNLNDPGFRINFIAKLAEKDARPWLPELAAILQQRHNYVAEISRLPEDDPRRFADPWSRIMLPGAYSRCWQDLWRYLMGLSSVALSEDSNLRYLGLLEATVRRMPGDTGGRLAGEEELEELYREKQLSHRPVGTGR